MILSKLAITLTLVIGMGFILHNLTSHSVQSDFAEVESKELNHSYDTSASIILISIHDFFIKR